MGRINDYMARAREYGMRHLAITDHGVMYGVVDWYKAAKANDLHPILGIEAYLAPRGIADRDKSSYHLLLLAENERGYNNLLKLASRASLDGFYYKPRVDLDMLNELKDGVIATSACLGGPVANNFLNGKDDEAERLAKTLREMFGPKNFYLEIQDHGIEGQKRTNPQIIELARKLDLPLVATNDVHYVNRGDAAAQELLVCVQTNTTLDDPKRMRMESDQFFFKSPDEMWRIFGDIPEALENTVSIAERCNVDLEFGRLHLPDPGIPDNVTAHEHLVNLCWTGVKQRYPEMTDEVRRRLEYELRCHRETGFSSYMLIVRDFADFARTNRIPFGVRGSAAASIMLYCLGITDIDPMANRLVFERFLNPERREMPDIDMDFADDRRGEVIEYVAEKYGHDRVAQIITFGTHGRQGRDPRRRPRAGLRLGDVDRVAKLIPTDRCNMTIERRAGREPRAAQALRDGQPQVKRLIDTARQLEGRRAPRRDARGRRRHLGRPAGRARAAAAPVARATKALADDAVHMENAGRDRPAQDGLPGAGQPDHAGRGGRSSSRERRGSRARPGASCRTDDPKTYEMLADGETSACSSLRAPGMTRYIQELQPQLRSPTSRRWSRSTGRARWQHIPELHRRAKHGAEPISYPHPRWRTSWTRPTASSSTRTRCCRSRRSSPATRWARPTSCAGRWARRSPKMMAERARAASSTAPSRTGYTDADAETILDLIEPFAGYAFNKAHATCYGTIAYQTAYLKANYPARVHDRRLRLAASHPAGTADVSRAAVG